MKIELIKQTFDNCTGYKFKPLKWCCDKLEENKIIDLVNEYDYEDYTSDNLFPMMAIRHTEHFYDWGDEYEEDYYYKITHCPFCGEPIKIFVVGQEDASEIYSKLKEERDKNWKKYNKTDSKKKEAELKKIVDDLDRKINYFYNLVEYMNLEEI